MDGTSAAFVAHKFWLTKQKDTALNSLCRSNTAVLLLNAVSLLLLEQQHGQLGA